MERFFTVPFFFSHSELISESPKHNQHLRRERFVTVPLLSAIDRIQNARHSERSDESISLKTHGFVGNGL